MACAQPSCLCVILQTKVNGEKDVDDIRTLMEEIDMRIKETKQQTYEFKRDVILGEQAVPAQDAHGHAALLPQGQLTVHAAQHVAWQGLRFTQAGLRYAAAV